MKKRWETKKLSEICEVFADGDWVESKDQSATGVRLIQTGNVGEGVFKGRADKARYISEATFKRLRCTEIFEGDCLISRLPAPVGRSCILPGTGERMITAVDCTIVRFQLTEMLPKFFNFYSQSGDYISAVAKQCTGTTRSRISRSNLALIPIPVPSLPEQRRIVGILDEAFAGIATAKANAEKNLKNARALFESHLNAVFTHRGHGWVDRKLGDVCERVSVGHVGETSKFYCDAEEGIPFLRSQNVRRGFLELEGVRHVTKDFHEKLKKSQLRSGDLLFVRVGANRGDCSFVPDDLGAINCANIVFARPKEGNAEYLSRYCQSPVGRYQLLGMSVGSAQGVINTSSVAELIVPLPNKDEQLQIVEVLKTMEEETQRLESIYQRKLVALEELKTSLLHQAFSGQL